MAGAFDFITDFLGYSSPNQRAGEGFFGQPTYTDETTGQEIQTHSIQGLQKFVQLHPEATYGPAFQRISQNVYDMEATKRQKQADEAAQKQADQAAADQKATENKAKLGDIFKRLAQTVPEKIGGALAQDQVIARTLGGEGLFGKDTVKQASDRIAAEQGQVNALEKEGVQFGNQKELEGIKQVNKLEENVQQGGITRENSLYSSRLSLDNQKKMADYNADIAKRTRALEAENPKMPEGTRTAIATSMNLADNLEAFKKDSIAAGYPSFGAKATELKQKRINLKTQIMYKLFGGTSTKEQEAMVDAMLPDPTSNWYTSQKNVKEFASGYDNLIKQYRGEANALKGGGTDQGPR